MQIVCLSDSHKQQAATIAFTTTHPKHLCCIVNAAAARGKLIPASALEWKELCFTELSGFRTLKLQVDVGDGNRMTPCEISEMCTMVGEPNSRLKHTLEEAQTRQCDTIRGRVITVYWKALSMQKLQCIRLKQMQRDLLRQCATTNGMFTGPLGFGQYFSGFLNNHSLSRA